MVVVSAAVLAATTPQTLTTTSAGPGAGHTHMVMLTPANLTALRAGTTVDVTSSNDGQHTHTYRITCA